MSTPSQSHHGYPYQDGFQVEVLADSVARSMDLAKSRLTTMRWRYPRFIHSECMTHRQFSRNAASLRAIPMARLRQQVMDDPAGPVEWGRAQAGMQAAELLDTPAALEADRQWLWARRRAVDCHRTLEELGVAKQITNRVLEPWVWMESIWTATESGWDNLLFLRDHEDAQPEFRFLARLVKRAYLASTPQPLGHGEWHLPYYRPAQDGDVWQDLRKVCAARCARVSYLTHEGVRDVQKDLELFDRLVERGDEPRHLSPLEHVAQVDIYNTSGSGNLGAGWRQLRKDYERPVPPVRP